MTSLYKEYAQSWDSCVSVLTFLILICSKIALIGLIFIIQIASLTNLNLPVYIKSVLKGSEAFKSMEISPDFDLTEHYIHMPDRNLSQAISNPFVDRN